MRPFSTMQLCKVLFLAAVIRPHLPFPLPLSTAHIAIPKTFPENSRNPHFPPENLTKAKGHKKQAKTRPRKLPDLRLKTPDSVEKTFARHDRTPETPIFFRVRVGQMMMGL